MKLSILIPVYNESLTINRVVDAARAAPLPGDVERELIIVDDGSVDGTAETLEQYRLDPSIRLVRLERNQGKGSAIRAGIPHATGDWILIQDGDLEYDPSAYMSIVQAFIEKKVRVVYGSRFLGVIESMGWPYRLVNRMLTAWTNLLYGISITDEATAYKAFETRLLRGLQLKCRRFEFCPEVTGILSRRKIPIHEVPVRYLGRTTAQGKKIRWHDAFAAFWVLLRERVVRPDA
ncbi:MAG: glycosyltransferase family 2 protein [Pseudomonadota bacterium]